MKLWKENKVNQEWEIDNEEIAKKFIGSLFFVRGKSIAYSLVEFISAKDGLNSSWDWDVEKGSIEGSKDMKEILDIIDNLTAKENKNAN